MKQDYNETEKGVLQLLKIKRNYEELSVATVNSLIYKHKGKIGELNKLYEMYENKNPILRRTKEEGKANNRISHPYARYITSTAVGYFMGRNVAYNFDDEVLGDEYDRIMRFNDEHSVNNANATNCSIFGCSAEVLFLDENAEVRFASVDPREVIYIVNPDIMEDLNMVIRHWDVFDEVLDKSITYVEVYDHQYVTTYQLVDGAVSSVVDIQPHNFGDVPWLIYLNNKEVMGDFQPVMGLINAYDLTQSDTANDFQEFTDSHIVINGAMMDEDTMESTKHESKVFLFPDGNGDVKFVTKDINDSATESYKDRLVMDIHKLSHIPDMSDEAFSGNASGVAIQYKLAGLEYQTSIKESHFRKALLRRIELIFNILSIKNNAELDVIECVNIVFNRNLVRETENIIDNVVKLSNVISKEAQYELLDGIVDANKEKERHEIAKEEAMNQFSLPQFNEEDEEDDQQ